ncbi:GYDIA family GHMP kinase [Aquimarina sp. 2201CG14-23]|uniref:GYDIA family GHMP kinase n=1 Tax=Aquimarina mycalae TaxID=3040073 RepID=UPI0024781E39|nr:GYDIA family GHMP kinase [Aquimarina sp. 2201CG14-23]MDH7445495.1 GYDIA family GHMP kinase [Aquimarina sp. 2201CG14-23]
MLKKTFYSHGKLLITGEYLVLDGISALAVPTKKGQWLTIEENNSDQISWKSFDHKEECWFEANLILENDTIRQTKNVIEENEITNTLIKILIAAKELNPNFLSKNKGYTIETKLEFDREWGLGSSSTLINNIAQWAEVNAFTLLENSFGGSGYDIACAQYDTPIIYKLNNNVPVIKKTEFNPIFKDQLFFVYLNQKQSSKESIKHYQSLSLKDFDHAEAVVNEITDSILYSKDIREFETLINSHEEIISSIIKTPTVKSTLFPDYTRSIKSLGGWGGDFILVTGSQSDMMYFRNKGYDTIIPYTEMILE